MRGPPVSAEASGPAAPEPGAVARTLAGCLPAALVPLFPASFVRSSFLYEEFVYRLALRVAREAGLEAALREPGTAEEVAARAGLALEPARVPLDWLLRHLAARGALESEERPEGWRYRLAAPLPAPDPAAVRDRQAAHEPGWLPAYALAETVARDYPAFLRGAAAGEEILFSPARFRLWFAYFSNDNGLYAVNNRLGAIAVEAWLAGPAPRILELGGGLGSGALAVLERLEAAGRLGELAEYRFTELVPVFQRRGERTLRARFPGLAALTAAVLDMDRPFAEQGVAPGSFALVYAVNTLHVARDLGFTLREIAAALRPGGRLVISECVRPRPGQTLYPEFVFNLMEAFRAPRLDPDYRPNGGFLTPEQWGRAMAAAGLVDVRLLPDLPGIRDAVPFFYVGAIGAMRAA